MNTQYAFPAQIPEVLSPAERDAVDSLALYTGGVGGSNHLPATKPETAGLALADSPAGQAAWIYEKFQSKTDNDGLAEDALSIDDMLNAISLYPGHQQCRVLRPHLLGEQVREPGRPPAGTPPALTVFPRDIPRLPRNWMQDTDTDSIHYGEAERGGHFAALQHPRILISEIRDRSEKPAVVTTMKRQSDSSGTWKGCGRLLASSPLLSRTSVTDGRGRGSTLEQQSDDPVKSPPSPDRPSGHWPPVGPPAPARRSPPRRNRGGTGDRTAVQALEQPEVGQVALPLGPQHGNCRGDVGTESPEPERRRHRAQR